jgi:probable HAF family extracellular repeat protein
MGINDRGQIVGEYIDDRAVSRGFLLDRSGRFTRLDFPGSRSSQARSINDRGQVVGEYQDTAGSYHGYVWGSGDASAQRSRATPCHCSRRSRSASQREETR